MVLLFGEYFAYCGYKTVVVGSVSNGNTHILSPVAGDFAAEILDENIVTREELLGKLGEVTPEASTLRRRPVLFYLLNLVE